MDNRKDILLAKLRNGEDMRTGEQLALTMLLAIPAILAQLSMCLMSYIDAAMVGRLGSGPAAAIGLVSTTTWIFGSFCYGNSSGFSVQVAHRCGARDFRGARRIFRQGIVVTLLLSGALTLLALVISGPLPRWLGGGTDIVDDASTYFRIYSLFLPVMQVMILAEAALVASGNMKVPSIASLGMCVLDVAFNYFFIYTMGMGAAGAALGTGLAELCAGAFLATYAFTCSRELRSGGEDGIPAGQEASVSTINKRALDISWPLWLQNLITRGAYITATVLIAPLGTVAIAANSFAITAEGFCYLPGYGMQDAASSLVGQSLGAGRKQLAKRFSFITIASGTLMMTALAVLMWIFAPQMMGLMSTDAAVVELGAECLRIEAWAELFYAVSIVAYGCCIGAGDTLVPSVINLVSMWVIRIGLALLLIPRFGLQGYWVAMASELTAKGIIFAVRIRRGRWMKTSLTQAEHSA